jgi:hypothetical protein
VRPFALEEPLNARLHAGVTQRRHCCVYLCLAAAVLPAANAAIVVVHWKKKPAGPHDDLLLVGCCMLCGTVKAHFWTERFLKSQQNNVAPVDEPLSPGQTQPNLSRSLARNVKIDFTLRLLLLKLNIPASTLR